MCVDEGARGSESQTPHYLPPCRRAAKKKLVFNSYVFCLSHTLPDAALCTCSWRLLHYLVHCLAFYIVCCFSGRCTPTWRQYVTRSAVPQELIGSLNARRETDRAPEVAVLYTRYTRYSSIYQCRSPQYFQDVCVSLKFKD